MNSAAAIPLYALVIYCKAHLKEPQNWYCFACPKEALFQFFYSSVFSSLPVVQDFSQATQCLASAQSTEHRPSTHHNWSEHHTVSGGPISPIGHHIFIANDFNTAKPHKPSLWLLDTKGMVISTTPN